MDRTNLLKYILISEKRKDILKKILEFPKRQWSCSALEEQTGLPHATVFRVLHSLKEYGLLRTTRINKKDILYELVEENPFINELTRLLYADKITAKEIALEFTQIINKQNVVSILLYGSSVKGDILPESDIDILIVLQRDSKEKSKEIYDAAAELSSRKNKTIAVVIMNAKELQKEKQMQFLRSVQEANEVLYGKNPF